MASRAEITRLEEERSTLTAASRTRRWPDGTGGFRARPGPASRGGSAIWNSDCGMRGSNSRASPRASKRPAAKPIILPSRFQERLADYLNEPENARRMFDANAPGEERGSAAELRGRLLEEWVARLEQRDLLVHILSSYQLRNICHDYCPPIHLQQLKKALASREEYKRVEDILKQFPARQYLDAAHRRALQKIRKTPREEVRAVAIALPRISCVCGANTQLRASDRRPWNASTWCATNAPGNFRT